LRTHRYRECILALADSRGEWQQVFMASASPWKDLSYELHAEAHPVAFYLLLKALTTLGRG